jgi:FAD binding domain
MRIRKITRWSVDAVLASSFRRGGAFVVGDAAHGHPPTGGLGLTSAIHDAQNLCRKIAAVLADGASPALLDTYEAERRPVDERNCQRSLENVLNHFAIATALGVAPENSAEQNMALLRRMWSGRPEDAELRSSALRAMRAQSMEFSELNVEYGYTYESAAVVPDDSPAPEPGDDIRVYEPSTRPGAPLPHSASRRDLRRDGRSATPRAGGSIRRRICLAAEHQESPVSPAMSRKRPGATTSLIAMPFPSSSSSQARGAPLSPDRRRRRHPCEVGSIHRLAHAEVR